LERDKMKKNAEKKGQSFFEYETIDDIFE
jgi:hypothetical protein